MKEKAFEMEKTNCSFGQCIAHSLRLIGIKLVLLQEEVAF